MRDIPLKCVKCGKRLIDTVLANAVIYKGSTDDESKHFEIMCSRCKEINLIKLS